MFRFGICLLALLTITGCTSTSTSSTKRTAVEQLLISNAIDQTLDKVDFTPFAGQTVFLDEKYLDCTDQKYLVSSIRHRLLRSNARLADKVEEADIVIEPRAGSVGTNTVDAYLGMPEIVLPGMLTLPEVRFLERKNQEAVAKIGLVAYDAKTKASLGDGGMSLARSDDSNWFLLGIGPYQNGSIRKEIKKGIKIQPNQPVQSIPQHVAFSAPVQNLQTPSKLQLASDKKLIPPAPPKKDNTNAPLWTK
ncbi:MAG: hypothetical protein JKY95_00980 [Planctomycetaceae bacterium]|nr:hypothetical protein [Planctomycetaceae bacterium]